MSLLGTILAVGVGAAGVKVYERMKENNPQGFTSVPQEAEKAAKELYEETAPVIKEKAAAKVGELKEKYPKQAAQVGEVVDKVKEKIK